jgi:hypothetical protein
LRPIKSLIFLKYMPRLHLLPSRISTPPTNRGTPPLGLLWHVQSPLTSKNSPST